MKLRVTTWATDIYGIWKRLSWRPNTFWYLDADMQRLRRPGSRLRHMRTVVDSVRIIRYNMCGVGELLR